MIGGIFFIVDPNLRRGGKTQVKNDSVDRIFFFIWIFKVRRFRNPTNKISVALASTSL
jgi:hypothetical protein